jgi:hypothetical protein|tara:strand:+ start:192 stop:617 length:426 start_codon:yes stop_codon:yes gene_type:complete
MLFVFLGEGLPGARRISRLRFVRELPLVFPPELPFVPLKGALPELRFQALLFVPPEGDGHRMVPLQVLGGHKVVFLPQVLELLLVFLEEVLELLLVFLGHKVAFLLGHKVAFLLQALELLLVFLGEALELLLVFLGEAYPG